MPPLSTTQLICLVTGYLEVVGFTLQGVTHYKTFLQGGIADEQFVWPQNYIKSQKHAEKVVLRLLPLVYV